LLVAGPIQKAAGRRDDPLAARVQEVGRREIASGARQAVAAPFELIVNFDREAGTQLDTGGNLVDRHE